MMLRPLKAIRAAKEDIGAAKEYYAAISPKLKDRFGSNWRSH